MTDDAPSLPMTAEDAVKRIAAECGLVDPYGGVGIPETSANANTMF